MPISDWSSDVFSSDLKDGRRRLPFDLGHGLIDQFRQFFLAARHDRARFVRRKAFKRREQHRLAAGRCDRAQPTLGGALQIVAFAIAVNFDLGAVVNALKRLVERSDEHTSELQSHMRSSYAVFCLNKKK